MWTNSFSLGGSTGATLDLRYRHRDIGDTFDIDISDDGGTSWVNVFNSTDSNPSGDLGDPLSLNLTPWAGSSDVMARFRYYGTGWLYYAQVDELALSCTQPAIRMTKTVGTTDGVCSTEDSIVVSSGTEVYYCYTTENTGNVPLEMHDLVDDQLGTILDDYVLLLNPGDTVEVIVGPEVINTTTTNVGTWTAAEVTGANMVSAEDDATVVVVENNTCDDAIEIMCPPGGGSFSVLGSTLFASFTDQGECGTTHTAPDVWYRIAGNGGAISVTTCNAVSDYDTKLTVWSGDCGSPVCVDGVDDECTGFSALLSTVDFVSTIGETYYVMVHGYSSGVGDFQLDVTCEVPVELQSFTIE